MIAKGNQRGGGQQLATHLLNSRDNDRVEIADVRGAIAPDLHGAFAEWHAEASNSTKCKKYIYSLSINPDPKQGPLTREQYFDFITRAEKKLGLADQPRAVVFHVKYGREHCHVAWSRIDPFKMRAVQLSHDRQQMRFLVRAFARDHGLTLPRGLQRDRGLARFNEHTKGENLSEKQQQERTGLTKADRQKAITEAWRITQTGQEFVKKLTEQNYFLARGNTVAYVVVDLAGEVHSLPKQIEGARTADVRKRLSAYPLDQLPAVATAQEHARQMREYREQQIAQRESPKQTPTKKAEPEPTRPTVDERRAELALQHAKRRLPLDAAHAAQEREHADARDALHSRQQAENDRIATRRAEGRPTGLAAFLGRITGVQKLIEAIHRKEDRARDRDQASQARLLIRDQRREAHALNRQSRALASLEARERRSLESTLSREEFQRIATPERQPVRGPPEPDPAELKSLFNTVSKDNAPERDAGTSADRQPPSPTPDSASPDRDKLADAFNRRATQKDRQEPGKDRGRGGDPGRERSYRTRPPDRTWRR